MKLPAGPGVPAAPASANEYTLAQAVNACARVATLTAEVAVSGSVRGRRVRGRLSAGVADPASARLEAVLSFGAPLFIFAARDDDATLLLPRDARVLEHGRPSAVLDAVAGVPVDAFDLRQILTGCPPVFVAAPARRFGDTWQVASVANYEVYLHRESTAAPWGLVAMIRRVSTGGLRWRADFVDRQDGVPRSIRLMSVDDRDRIGSEFDLKLELSQVDINTPLDDAAFTVQIPPDAEPITLEELRRSGPFGLGKSDGR